MKLFKDVSFWCIILTILIVMIIHNILTSDKIIEGQDNMEGGDNSESNNSEGNIEAVIELTLGRNRGSGLKSIKGSTVASTVAATVDTLDNVETNNTIDNINNIDNIDTIRNLLRQKKVATAGLSNDATDQEIEDALTNITQTLEDPNSQGNIDQELLLAIQEIESLKEQINQLTLQNEEQQTVVQDFIDNSNSISLPTNDEMNHENYPLDNNGTVDCSNKTFLGVADEIRHPGFKSSWGEEMINQIEGPGFLQTFKDNNEDIPCSNYYYYKPTTEGNGEWVSETGDRGEASGGFYVLERENDGSSQKCINTSVRTNSDTINNVKCSHQSTKVVNDPGRLITPGGISGDWAISNGLDISSIDAIKSGLGINTTVDEITRDDSLDNDVNTSSKTPNPESNLKDDGTWYKPLDGVEGEGRTSSSWEECQQRCLNTEGCVYFNAFSDGDCHITDGSEGTSMGEYRQDIIDLNPGVAGTNPTIKSGRAEMPHTGGCSPVNRGIADRVKGAFNASCNSDGEENDYCRFIGNQTDPFGIWLSCVSPDNNCKEDPLHNSRYAWSIDELPDDVKGVFSDENEEVQKIAALKNFFKEECSSKGKCVGADELPDSPDPFSPGVAGYSNRARGFFDASCNGEVNDYCRFVGNSSNSNGIWLSCWSPSNEDGCQNKYPTPSEKLGWNLEDIDENSKVVSNDTSVLENANSSLRGFFERNCASPSCIGGLNPSGGCNTLNADQDSKTLCGEGRVYENISGVYKQCYLDSSNICRPSDEVCKP